MRSRPFDREVFDSHFEERVRVRPRTAGALPAAGVYLAHGRWKVVAFGSAEERALLAVGALLVASVTFDGAPVPALAGGVAARLRPGRLLPWAAR
jgi:hypothetical protein